MESPATIRFTWHVKNRKSDPDNIAFAKKYVLDGMVKAGIIPDDTHRYIKGFEDRFVISAKEGVEVERIESE